MLKVLSKKLKEEDKEEDQENRLLFDIVAGTSIGAMNSAVLVSQFLQTGSWEDAIEKLELFWTDKEEGLASTLSQQDIKYLVGLNGRKHQKKIAKVLLQQRLLEDTIL